MKPKPPGLLLRIFAVPAVTIYLAVVYLWLSVRKKIPSIRAFRLFLARLRPRYAGSIDSIVEDSGHCYSAPMPEHLLDDESEISSLTVLEDGKALPRGHAVHDEIRQVGEGRFSHWGRRLYFSTTDNSDPRSNGRRYTVEERRRTSA